MFRSQQCVRRGFTLVELLVAMAIIASLIGLTVPFIYRSIRTVRDGAMQTEVNQLAESIQGYKSIHARYPPCMGTIDLVTRQKAFERHMAVAYPNYSISYTNARTSIGTMTKTTGYNYLIPGTSTLEELDLNTLDAAESLVFWLAGFPTPLDPTTKTPIAPQKLYGFHKDQNDPLKRQASDTNMANPLSFRTQHDHFGFDQNRLVDNDGDGWLEYIPVRSEGGQKIAPYVYFDSGTYGLLSSISTGSAMCGYPRSDATSITGTSLAFDFGVAVPMALDVMANRIMWAQPTGFQIICGGQDSKYAGNPEGTLMSLRVPTYPNPSRKNGEVFAIGGGPFSTPNMTEFELDNMTNMGSKRLEAIRNEAQK